MAFPKQHFSHSQYWSWVHDRDGYIGKYFFNIEQSPTPPMLLGSITHKAIEDDMYDYRDDLANAGFTPNYIKGIESAIKGLKRPSEQEKLVTTPTKFIKDGKEVELLGYLDGYDKNHIYEWKTGSPWNQQKVDEATQLTMYALIHFRNTGKIPKLTLVHFDVKKGKRTIWKTKRTKEQLQDFWENELKPVMEEINQFEP